MFELLDTILVGADHLRIASFHHRIKELFDLPFGGVDVRFHSIHVDRHSFELAVPTILEHGRCDLDEISRWLKLVEEFGELILYPLARDRLPIAAAALGAAEIVGIALVFPF